LKISFYDFEASEKKAQAGAEADSAAACAISALISLYGQNAFRNTRICLGKRFNDYR
jgi:hypothetical protein